MRYLWCIHDACIYDVCIHDACLMFHCTCFQDACIHDAYIHNTGEWVQFHVTKVSVQCKCTLALHIQAVFKCQRPVTATLLSNCLFCPQNEKGGIEGTDAPLVLSIVWEKTWKIMSPPVNSSLSVSDVNWVRCSSQGAGSGSGDDLGVCWRWRSKCAGVVGS